MHGEWCCKKGKLQKNLMKSERGMKEDENMRMNERRRKEGRKEVKILLKEIIGTGLTKGEERQKEIY